MEFYGHELIRNYYESHATEKNNADGRGQKKHILKKYVNELIITDTMDIYVFIFQISRRVPWYKELCEV